MLLREAYEHAYGYADHFGDPHENPFPLVTFHETRKYTFTRELEIKRLILHDVPKRANMSITALFQTPMPDYLAIVRVCVEQSKLTNEAYADLEDKIKKTTETPPPL